MASLCLIKHLQITCKRKLPRNWVSFSQFSFCACERAAASNNCNGYNDDTLRNEKIFIYSHDDDVMHFDAVIQDTAPSGSCQGTVIACHGAPGSHEDFKYFLPYLKNMGVRFVGINFPGFGYTASHPKLRYDNRERLEFAQQIVKHLDSNAKLVFVGHSRGSETALKLSVLNKERTTAVVLINPLTLLINRGLRPLWRIRLFAWLWNLGNVAQFILRPAVYLETRTNLRLPYASQREVRTQSPVQCQHISGYLVKLRANTGNIAAASALSMNTLHLESQIEYIHKLNHSDIGVFIAYSGCDPFIEPELSRHFADSFNDIKHLVCHPGITNESIAFHDIRKLVEAGARRIAVYFPEDDHFIQKHRAKLLTEIIRLMLKEKHNSKIAEQC